MPAAKHRKTKRWSVAVDTDWTHPPQAYLRSRRLLSPDLSVQESVAERARIRHAYADLLHQPRRAQSQCDPQG